MESSPDRVRARLIRVRNAMVSSRLTLGSLFWLAVLLTLWLFLFTLDNLLDLPGELRFPLALGALIAAVYGFFRHILQPALNAQSLEDTALILEERYGVPRNRLINAFQLESRTPDSMSERESAYARRSVDGGDKRLHGVPLKELAQSKKLVSWTLVALALIIIWVAYAATAPGALINAAKRYSLPLADVPPVGKVDLILDPHDHLSLPEDDTLHILCIVEARGDEESDLALLRQPPHIVIRTGTDPVPPTFDAARSVTMAPLAKDDLLDAFSARTGHRASAEDLAKFGSAQEIRALNSDGAIFSFTIPTIKRPVAFRVFHREGRTYSKGIQVGVIAAPKITASSFRVSPPPYTGLPPTDSLGPPQDVAGLAGSSIEVEVELDRAVDQLAWSSQNADLIPFSKIDKSLTRWRAETTLTAAAPYAVQVTRDNMRRPATAASGQILLREDRPPQVDFTNSSRNLIMAPGERLRLGVSGFDDYGLASLRLTCRSALGGSPTELIKEWVFGDAPGQIDPFSQTHTVTLDASRYTPGYEYIFEVSGTDHHPDAQTGISRPFLLRIQDISSSPPPNIPEAAVRLFQLLDEAIARQQEALNNVRNVSNYLDEALGFDPQNPRFSFHEHLAQIHQNQDAVRGSLNNLVAEAGSEPPDFVPEIKSLLDGEVIPVLKNIGRLDSPDHWLGSASPVEKGELAEDEPKTTIRFPNSTGRYVGIVATSTHGGGTAAISELTPLDPEGDPFPGPFVQSWHLAESPTPVDNFEIFPEIDADAARNLFDQLKRRPLHTSESEKVDLIPVYESQGTDNKATYAAREILCEEARQARILVSMDDNIRVWINGELVLEERGYSSEDKDRFRADIDLLKGPNRVLVEVLNGTGGWDFYLRFTGTDGSRLAVSKDGSLAPIPEFRAAAFDGQNGDHIIDRRKEGWTSSGIPGMIMIDLGREFSLGGLDFEGGDQKESQVRGYDVFVTSQFTAADVLPPLLAEIERTQSFLLDQLVRIRSHEVKRSEEAVPVDPREDRPDDGSITDLILKEKVEDFLDDVIQFRDEAAELDQRRASILAGADFSREDLEALANIKDAENRIAKALEQAADGLPPLDQLDIPDPEMRDAVEVLVKKADELVDLAAEKAATEPDLDTVDIDDAIANVADELLDSIEIIAPEAVAAAEPPPSELPQDTPLDTSDIPLPLEDQVSEIDERQNRIMGEIEAAAEDAESGDAGERAVQPDTAAAPATGTSGGENPAPQPGAAPPESEDDPPATNGSGDGTPAGGSTQFGAGDGEPSPDEKMDDVYNQQKIIREATEALAIELETHNLPSADLKGAAEKMKAVEQAILDRDSLKLRQAYTEAADLTGAARENIAKAKGLQYLRDRIGSEKPSGPVGRGRDAPPKGFETMVGKYFEFLAEDQ